MEDDIKSLLKTEYTKYYSAGNSPDSPEETRVSLQRRVRTELSSYPDSLNIQVLNIGAGTQVIEANLMRDIHGQLQNKLPKVAFHTLDIADIPDNRLTAKKHPNVTHHRGDASNLPFADNTFRLVISNLAIDFMPKNALDEATRVLAPNGKVILYLHHPDLVTETTMKKKDDATTKFWKYLKDNQILYKDAEQIKEEFIKHGLTVIEVKLNTQTKHPSDKWWEVVATKNK